MQFIPNRVELLLDYNYYSMHLTSALKLIKNETRRDSRINI